MNNYKGINKANENIYSEKHNYINNVNSKKINKHSEQLVFNTQEKHADYALLAIDGGGTTTLAKIVDTVGNVIFSVEAGTSNYYVIGIKDMADTLEQLLEKLVLNIYENNNVKKVVFDVGVFAIAGIDTYKDLSIIKNVIKGVLNNSNVEFNKIVIENDALSILHGATPYHPGVILISGTGSIAFAHNMQKKYMRSGGWGHRLDDEGSGYWIGKEAIKTILKSNDGRRRETLLSSLVLKFLQLHDYEELFHWVYSAEYTAFNVSQLAEIVKEASSLGDIESQRILDNAVTELQYLVATVADKTYISKEKFKLLLMGGVLQNSEYIYDKLVSRIENEMPGVELVKNNKNPIDYIIQRGLKLK